MTGGGPTDALAAEDSAAPIAGSPRDPGPRRRRRRRGRPMLIGDRRVVTRGLPSHFWQDLYHLSMTASWPVVFAALATLFFGLNLIFAAVYRIEPGCIANLNPPGFWGDFFFSIETSATVGFGDMHPQTPYGHGVASLEIFCSIVSIALITGVMFARFSRPRARVLFGRYVVVRPIDGHPTLMLRAANARQNVIVEASAHLRLMRNEVSAEGFRIRRILDLPLVREHTPIFALGWTMMHVIDETSPLAGETQQTLKDAQGVLILTLTGVDETTGQDVTARALYLAESMLWNHAFRDILTTDPEGYDVVDYSGFHEVEPLTPAGHRTSHRPSSARSVAEAGEGVAP